MPPTKRRAYRIYRPQITKLHSPVCCVVILPLFPSHARSIHKQKSIQFTISQLKKEIWLHLRREEQKSNWNTKTKKYMKNTHRWPAYFWFRWQFQRWSYSSSSLCAYQLHAAVVHRSSAIFSHLPYVCGLWLVLPLQRPAVAMTTATWWWDSIFQTTGQLVTMRTPHTFLTIAKRQTKKVAAAAAATNQTMNPKHSIDVEQQQLFFFLQMHISSKLNWNVNPISMRKVLPTTNKNTRTSATQQQLKERERERNLILNEQVLQLFARILSALPLRQSNSNR